MYFSNPIKEQQYEIQKNCKFMLKEVQIRKMKAKAVYDLAYSEKKKIILIF